MPLLSRIASLWRNLLYKQQADGELHAEVQGYADMLADEKVKAGMDRHQARRQAAIESGGTEQVKEISRHSPSFQHFSINLSMREVNTLSTDSRFSDAQLLIKRYLELVLGSSGEDGRISS